MIYIKSGAITPLYDGPTMIKSDNWTLTNVNSMIDYVDEALYYPNLMPLGIIGRIEMLHSIKMLSSVRNAMARSGRYRSSVHLNSLYDHICALHERGRDEVSCDDLLALSIVIEVAQHRGTLSIVNAKVQSYLRWLANNVAISSYLSNIEVTL